jgi:hypothetical protein
MSVYTFQEATQQFAHLLEEAKHDRVLVTNLNGERFAIQFVANPPNPPAKPNLTRDEIVSYIRETRERI